MSLEIRIPFRSVRELPCTAAGYRSLTLPPMAVNFFADAFAVKELLTPPDPRFGVPAERFYLLPLDITTQHLLPFPMYKRRVDPAFHTTSVPSEANGKPPITHFTSSVFERTREVMLGFGSDAMELHDIVAVWCAIENSHDSEGNHDGLAKGWHAIKRRFDVER
jgi:hypothetical protein